MNACILPFHMLVNITCLLFCIPYYKKQYDYYYYFYSYEVGSTALCSVYNHRLLSRKLKFQKTLPIKTFPNTNKIRMQRPNLYPRKFSGEKSINGTVQADFRRSERNGMLQIKSLPLKGRLEWNRENLHGKNLQFLYSKLNISFWLKRRVYRTFS
jgi:hypothetical protein